jgi:hypothetical protein
MFETNSNSSQVKEVYQTSLVKAAQLLVASNKNLSTILLCFSSSFLTET